MTKPIPEMTDAEVCLELARQEYPDHKFGLFTDGVYSLTVMANQIRGEPIADMKFTLDDNTVAPIFRVEIGDIYVKLCKKHNDECKADREIVDLFESGPVAQARAILEVRRVKG